MPALKRDVRYAPRKRTFVRASWRQRSVRCGGLLLRHPDLYLPCENPFSARRTMNPTVAITLAVSLCICSPALGEQIEWNDATCSNKLTFDARKVDRDALKGTIDILFNELPYVPTDPFFSMEDAARADVGKLERECAAVIERQKRHKLLPLPGLESFRSSLVDDTQESCGFNLATMRAIKDAAALRDASRHSGVRRICRRARRQDRSRPNMDRDRGSELPRERVAGGVPEQGSRRGAEAGRIGAQAAPGAELRMEQLRGALHANERTERRARQDARRDREEIEGAIQGQAPMRPGRLTRPRTR